MSVGEITELLGLHNLRGRFVILIKEHGTFKDVVL